MLSCESQWRSQNHKLGPRCRGKVGALIAARDFGRTCLVKGIFDIRSAHLLFFRSISLA
jgi:hypothetical protein